MFPARLHLRPQWRRYEGLPSRPASSVDAQGVSVRDRPPTPHANHPEHAEAQPGVFLPDVVDLDEMRTGKRREAGCLRFRFRRNGFRSNRLWFIPVQAKRPKGGKQNQHSHHHMTFGRMDLRGGFCRDVVNPSRIRAIRIMAWKG